MDHALGILKKTSPADLQKTLKGLKVLMGDKHSDTYDALIKRIHLPFDILEDVDGSDRPFLLCRYNKVGSSGGSEIYRSPWTNMYYSFPDRKQLKQQQPPPMDDEQQILRQLEFRANEVWDAYRSLYYGYEAVGSVYLQQKGGSSSSSFQGLFGISKSNSGGSWNSVHIVNVGDPIQDGRQTKCAYHIESTVLLVLFPDIHDDDDQIDNYGNNDEEGKPDTSMNISASVAKNTSKTMVVQQKRIDTCHLENIGTLIEDIEIELRSNLEQVHVPRTKEVVDIIQSADDDDQIPSPRKSGAHPVLQGMEQSKMFQKKKAEILASSMD